MVTPAATQELKIALHPSTWPVTECKIEAVDGIYNGDGSTTPSPLERYAELEYYDKTIILPEEWPDRMRSFIRETMKGRRTYNCHMFAKWMIGMSDLTGTKDDMTPLIEDHTQLKPTDALKAGELGAIVVDYPDTTDKVFHSLLGVDENTGLTLQVMEPMGDMALAPGSEVVGYYQRTYANSGLYVVPPELYAARIGL